MIGTQLLRLITGRLYVVSRALSTDLKRPDLKRPPGLAMWS
jgi:hypothetical protein